MGCHTTRNCTWVSGEVGDIEVRRAGCSHTEHENEAIISDKVKQDQEKEKETPKEHSYAGQEGAEQEVMVEEVLVQPEETQDKHNKGIGRLDQGVKGQIYGTWMGVGKSSWDKIKKS